MEAVLTKKTRARREFEVTTPSGTFTVEYRADGMGFESVWVEGAEAAREPSTWRMAPRFDFAVGPHAGVIRLRARLWREVLGPIAFKPETFILQIDGETLYREGRELTCRRCHLAIESITDPNCPRCGDPI